MSEALEAAGQRLKQFRAEKKLAPFQDAHFGHREARRLFVKQYQTDKKEQSVSIAFWSGEFRTPADVVFRKNNVPGDRDVQDKPRKITGPCSFCYDRVKTPTAEDWKRCNKYRDALGKKEKKKNGIADLQWTCPVCAQQYQINSLDTCKHALIWKQPGIFGSGCLICNKVY